MRRGDNVCDLPNLQLELFSVKEFENQDWVKNIAQVDQTNLTKKHEDLNAAFLFQDDFLVGTIHGKNMAAQSNKQEKGTETKDATAVIH